MGVSLEGEVCFGLGFVVGGRWQSEVKGPGGQLLAGTLC